MQIPDQRALFASPLGRPGPSSGAPPTGAHFLVLFRCDEVAAVHRRPVVYGNEQRAEEEWRSARCYPRRGVDKLIEPPVVSAARNRPFLIPSIPLLARWSFLRRCPELCASTLAAHTASVLPMERESRFSSALLSFAAGRPQEEPVAAMLDRRWLSTHN